MGEFNNRQTAIFSELFYSYFHLFVWFVYVISAYLETIIWHNLFKYELTPGSIDGIHSSLIVP